MRPHCRPCCARAPRSVRLHMRGRPQGRVALLDLAPPPGDKAQPSQGAAGAKSLLARPPGLRTVRHWRRSG